MEHEASQNDDINIGFATTCLVYGVIDFSEFKKWLFAIIEEKDNVPDFVFRIADLEKKTDYILRRHEIVGFTPSWQGTDEEEEALIGIGYIIKKNYCSDIATKEEAISSLKKNKHIKEEFKKSFPFIKL